MRFKNKGLVCSIEECANPARYRGWCNAHYVRWQRHGDPLGSNRRPPQVGVPCRIEGCTRTAVTQRLCSMHYYRLRKWGDLGSPNPTISGSLEERFWRKVRQTPTCWLWTGATSGSLPYGVIYLSRGHYVMAHRVSHELFIGPIPEGLEIDHVCHSRDLSCPGGSSCPHRLCVNPDHLEAVTHLENMRRGRNCKAVVNV